MGAYSDMCPECGGTLEEPKALPIPLEYATDLKIRCNNCGEFGINTIEKCPGCSSFIGFNCIDSALEALFGIPYIEESR